MDVPAISFWSLLIYLFISALYYVFQSTQGLRLYLSRYNWKYIHPLISHMQLCKHSLFFDFQLPTNLLHAQNQMGSIYPFFFIRGTSCSVWFFHQAKRQNSVQCQNQAEVSHTHTHTHTHPVHAYVTHRMCPWTRHEHQAENSSATLPPDLVHLYIIHSELFYHSFQMCTLLSWLVSQNFTHLFCDIKMEIHSQVSVT